MQLLTLALLVLATSASQLPKSSMTKTTLGSTCFIRNVIAHPNDYLELTPGLSKAVTTLKKGGPKDIDKAGQWRIDKWVINGEPFFEFSNVQYDKYLSHGVNFATRELGIMATRASFANNKERSNLWQISPARLNTVVTIKHARTGGYLYAPKGDLKRRPVQLGSRPNSGTEYKWFISCN